MGTNPVTPPEYNSMRKHSVLNVRKVWLGICLWVCVHVCGCEKALQWENSQCNCTYSVNMSECTFFRAEIALG